MRPKAAAVTTSASAAPSSDPSASSQSPEQVSAASATEEGADAPSSTGLVATSAVGADEGDSVPGSQVDRTPTGPDWRRRSVDALTAVLSGLVMVALAAMLVIILLEVLGRDVFHFDLIWSQEAVALGVYVVTFIGGAVAYVRQEHFRLVAIQEKFSPRWRAIAAAVTEWIVVVVSAWVAVIAFPLVPDNWRTQLPDFPISQSWLELPVPVGMGIICIVALYRLSRMRWRVAGLTGAIVAVVAVVIVLSHDALSEVLTPGSTLVLTLPIGIAALVVGVPVVFAFGLLALLFLYLAPDLPLITVPLSMGDAVSNFVLVALPFFFILAYLLVEAGLGAKLGALAEVTLGRFTHGPMYSILVTMFIFSGLSGSKNADIAAIGGPLLDIGERRGYSRREGSALLAASAAMGETIPPSIALLILASLTTLSVGSLFVAGILPAVVLGLFLCIAVFRLPRPAVPKSAAPLGKVVRMLVINIPIIGGLVFLVGSIIAGLATPTEASALVVFYAMIIGVVVYRSLRPRGIVRAFSTAGSRAGAILLVVAAGGALTKVLALSDTPTKIADALQALGEHGAWLFLVASTLLLIIVGCVLEGLPAMLIFVPILAPVAAQLGISELHYGIVVILAMGIGTHTPPLGVGLYTASVVGNVNVESVGRAMWKYLAYLYAGLLVVIFVPGIATYLPGVLGIN